MRKRKKESNFEILQLVNLKTSNTATGLLFVLAQSDLVGPLWTADNLVHEYWKNAKVNKNMLTNFKPLPGVNDLERRHKFTLKSNMYNIVKSYYGSI